MSAAISWVARLVLLSAAAFTTAGLVEAALAAVDDAAVVDQPAKRGDQEQVTDPHLPGTPYGLPVADGDRAGWAHVHSAYPATDIFVGCGAPLVAPVYGTVIEVRRIDSYDPAVDDPATRGGRSLSIMGFDGVRYYLAHLDEVAAGLEAGDAVELGQVLGTMGDTGRASACHLHFSISPPCPGQEWSVRRGVVWPYPYLDAWRRGEQLSPAAEVRQWELDNPTACADAIAASP